MASKGAAIATFSSLKGMEYKSPARDSTFEVGKKVRIVLGDGSASCRGMIAYVNDEDGTCDIVFLSNSLGITEENRVERSRILDLFDFEYSRVTPSEANALKENGNVLFQIKDFDSAIEQYIKGLSVIAPQPPTIGARVLICFEDGIPIRGIIAGANASSFDVIYDSPIGDIDEEDGVPSGRIVPIATEDANFSLQGAFFMNLARAYLKSRRNGWAIRYATLAIGLFSSESDGMDDFRDKLKDAYFFRAKAFLLANRPGRALCVRFLHVCDF
jgi:hypothetical protein